MSVAIAGGGEASDRDVSALEAIIDQPLDPRFRRFIERHNGGTPEPNSFPVNGVDQMGSVDQFVAIGSVVSERRHVDDLGPRAYPVARSAGGNYVLLDQDQGGAIFFWDHEVEGGTHRLADDFDAFLDMLQPFDPSTLKPASGQVMSAWIDPDFLKQFGE